MTLSTDLELKSFVLLRLGERRFAVAADGTAELVAPSRVFRFPHKTPKIEGVILRRGRIVRSEEHTSELQSRFDIVCRLLLEKKKIIYIITMPRRIWTRLDL